MINSFVANDVALNEGAPFALINSFVANDVALDAGAPIDSANEADTNAISDAAVAGVVDDA